MSVFDQFPYTNFHELNLSWLLNEMKSLKGIYENMKKEIQDVIDFVNNFESHADELIDERIQVQLSLYNQRLSALEKELQILWDEINKDDGVFGMIEELRQDLQGLSDRVASIKHTLTAKIQEVYQLMHEYKYAMDAYVDSKTELLKEYIIENVTHVDRLSVINPITALFEPIQNVLDAMYDVIARSYGLTAEQYENIRLTAKQFDDYRITAYDYDTKSYFEVYFKLTSNLMLSPFTGKVEKIETVVNYLANLHKCALTAVEYDNLQLTAQMYDAFRLTAWVYDWFGKKVARYVTAADYDKLLLTAQEYDDKLIAAAEYDRGMISLVSTAINGCSDSSCSDYNILAGQITELSARVGELSETVNSIKPVVVSAGTTYVGYCGVGEVSAYVNIPSLQDDAIVSIMAGRDVLPTKIEVEPHRGVNVFWTSETTKNEPLSFNVSVQNKKEKEN